MVFTGVYRAVILKPSSNKRYDNTRRIIIKQHLIARCTGAEMKIPTILKY